jgi:hypothetical protein
MRLRPTVVALFVTCCSAALHTIGAHAQPGPSTRPAPRQATRPTTTSSVPTAADEFAHVQHLYRIGSGATSIVGLGSRRLEAWRKAAAAGSREAAWLVAACTA